MFKSYASLPIIEMLQSDYQTKLGKSHGIIVKCRSTLRWFAVRRRDTNGYLSLVYGSYDKFNLGSIMSELTEEERQSIKVILVDYSLFVEKHQEITEVFNMSNCKYAFKRLQNDSEVILHLLDGHQACENHGEEGRWIWPKGQPVKSEHMEATAIREFLEETGLEKLPEDFAFVPDVTFEANHERNYQDTFLLATVEKEFTCPDITQSEREVSSRTWLSFDELRSYLKGPYLEILLQAECMFA